MQSLTDPLYQRYRDGVTHRGVAAAVGAVRPPIREALEAFAFDGRETANTLVGHVERELRATRSAEAGLRDVDLRLLEAGSPVAGAEVVGAHELPPGGFVGSHPVATRLSASCKCAGKTLSLAAARRRIPAAALGLKKYRSGTVAMSTSRKDVDTPPPLGDSEESTVQHSPGEVVKPEFGQRRENDSEIASTLAGKESGNILNEEPSPIPQSCVCDPCELEEQSASLSGEAGSAPGDAEVLAGESAADEINTSGGPFGAGFFVRASWIVSSLNPSTHSPGPVIVRYGLNSDTSHVGVAGDSGPVLLEDAPAVLIRLALPDDSVSGSFEAEVEASDSREQGSDSKTSGSRSLIGFAASIGRSSIITIGSA